MEDKNLIVPNIGEFKDVEVIEVLVNEGDFIKKKWSFDHNWKW